MQSVLVFLYGNLPRSKSSNTINSLSHSIDRSKASPESAGYCMGGGVIFCILKTDIRNNVSILHMAYDIIMLPAQSSLESLLLQLTLFD